jgi:ketosteroid isomerase-like protein
MGQREDENKALVLEFIEALGSFDPERYEPYLADEPVYWVGLNRQVGRAAFRANTEAGKVLYPDPSAGSTERLAVLAEGDWVSILQLKTAPTNRVPDYRNIYAVFCEVVDGKIATQVEVLDSVVAAEAFDFTALRGEHNV